MSVFLPFDPRCETPGPQHCKVAADCLQVWQETSQPGAIYCWAILSSCFHSLTDREVAVTMKLFGHDFLWAL